MAGKVRKILHDSPVNKTATPRPALLRRAFGEHRDEVDVRMLSRPLISKRYQVKISALTTTPVDGHWSLAAFGDGVLDNRLDRRKTRAAGDQHNRLRRVFAQKKAAVRPVQADDVARFHGIKYLPGKLPARHLADVQMQTGIIMRRVSQRERAAPAILEQNIDILAGQELQVHWPAV